MSRGTALDLVYLVAGVGVIVSLQGLRSSHRARSANIVGACAVALAVVATFFEPHLAHYLLITAAMIVGVIAGVPAARTVRTSSLPRMVTACNGAGAAAAVAVALVELLRVHPTHLATYRLLEVVVAVVVGSVALAGSAVSFAKLHDGGTGLPITFAGQSTVISALLTAAIGLGVAVLVSASMPVLWAMLAISLVLGATTVLSVRRADMSTVIALLNVCTGGAVAATGLALNVDLLIAVGALVGASGVALVPAMSRAAGRSLPIVLLGLLGTVVPLPEELAGERSGEPPTSRRVGGRAVRTASRDVGALLVAARKVAIVPGYGLGAAQAHHALRGTVGCLTDRGVEVFYAVHPVAGRMPGHMNVLLAEADVPGGQLRELDDANAELASTEVVLVVGANDTVNPAAETASGTAISGMPILHVGRARSVVFVKRSLRPGFAGVENALFEDPGTVLLLGQATEVLRALITEVRTA